jgi:hypothetical protein
LQATWWKDAFRWETNFYIRTLKKAVMVEKWKTSGELWICWGRSVIREENYDKHNDRPLWPNAWIIRPISNSQVHKINIRQTSNLYVPTANLALHQKGVYYSGIKIYNHLPTAIKDLSGDKNKFRLALKRYLLHNSFYSLEEYFNTNFIRTITYAECTLAWFIMLNVHMTSITFV